MGVLEVDTKKIFELANKQKEELTALRQDFHARPELSWQEVETSKKIEKRLQDLGFENIRRGFKGTGSGVVADITGGGPAGKEGPRCVALRADIDALPIQEENSLDYASKTEGVMHACGHDAHATILLGAAKILAEIKERFSGKVRLIFQPAEEAGNDSGAPAMIKEGALDGVDAIGGLHVWSQLPVGVFATRSGPLMASADIWEVILQGQGGHGAMPHLAVDPTVAAGHLITMLQTVVSRETDPLESVVVSIGKIESGNAPNVIPDKATMRGNIRTTNRKTRSEMEGKVKRIVDGVAQAMRCSAKTIYTPIYPVTINDAELTDLYRQTAVHLFGKDKVEEHPIIMGSEDFSYYGEKVPATFAILGIGDEKAGTNRAHHSPHFNANDEALAGGAALLSSFALNYLSKS
jgi:amidohydrolase